MNTTEWECLLNVRGERKTIVVQVESGSLKQLRAEVKAIKSQDDWKNDVCCLYSRYLRDVP